MTALSPAAPDALASFSAVSGDVTAGLTGAAADDWGDLGATVAGAFRTGQYLPLRASAVRAGTQALPSPLAGASPDSP